MLSSMSVAVILFVNFKSIDRKTDGKHNNTKHYPIGKQSICREHSGSLVECLTGDRVAEGSSLTGVTVLCP